MTILRTAACAATLLAAATMIASPVLAATRTVPITIPLSAKPAQAPGWSPAHEIYNDRRWRPYRRHRGGIDGGDLLGVLLIGGSIAAIAAAIDKDKQERRGDRTDGRDYRGGDRPYDYRGADRPYDYRSDDRDRDRDYDRGDDARFGRGEADRAVEACTAEAARSGEVDEIFAVDRIDGEWRVKGDFRNGRDFTCSVDANGKAYIGLGDQARNEPRDEVAEAPRADEADDRYATAQSPDFADPRGN